jgi:nucleoside-diphosphate-sugar epimerase
MSLDLESLLVDKTLLLTGSTGFIGRNFASYLAKTETFQRGRLQVLCASRNKKSLAEIYPLRSGFQHFVWDIEMPYLAELNQVDYIVHLAGADRFLDSKNKSAEILSSTSTGTLNMLNLARRAGTSRILLASSGAVYPKCNESPNVFSESEYSSSLNLDSIDPYVAGKRKAEYLCNSYAEETGISVAIARIFSLIGPHFPINRHFAIGEFIKMCVADIAITVKSNSNIVRAYQHASDTSIWLAGILLSGSSTSVYNVGHDRQIRISHLAELVSELCGNKKPIRYLEETHFEGQQDFYIPDITKAQKNLGLENTVSLESSIVEVFEYYKKNPKLIVSAF